MTTQNHELYYALAIGACDNATDAIMKLLELLSVQANTEKPQNSQKVEIGRRKIVLLAAAAGWITEAKKDIEQAQHK